MVSLLTFGSYTQVPHITFFFSFSSFIDYKSILPISATLPNGSQLSASTFGMAAVTSSLIMHSVIYIPTFHVNLIAIAKLVYNNDCFVKFIANSCPIMQNHSKEMIGITKFQSGLYVLDSAGHRFTYNFVANHSCNIWHLRIGHLSHIGLQAVF